MGREGRSSSLTCIQWKHKDNGSRGNGELDMNSRVKKYTAKLNVKNRAEEI
jgi:hypothetical protein